MVGQYVCAVVVIVATGLIFRFHLREAWLTAQGQSSSEHHEELKGVLSLHLGQAAEIANRFHEFLPNIDGSARPRAEEAIRNLVRTLDMLTVTLREEPDSSA
jgi:hypothetical protein